MCWWLLTFTAPVASAGVSVWAQILTEATRGKKNLGTACCLVKWFQSTLFIVVFFECRWCSTSGRLSLPNPCLCQISGELFHTAVTLAFQRAKLKTQLMGSALSLSPLNGLSTSYINQITVEAQMWIPVLLLVFFTSEQIEPLEHVSQPLLKGVLLSTHWYS